MESDQPILIKCVDDSLPISQIGQWSVEKLHYLCRYIEMFINSMKNKKWRALNYIDLFAGPGKSRIDHTKKIVLGSPLIATQYQFDKFYFSESDKDNYDALYARCKVIPNSHRINLYNGNCNEIVTNIVDEILSIDRRFMSGYMPSLNLAFLDPFGLELEWTTIETLSLPQKMDLIIYFPQMGLAREMGNEVDSQGECIIDRFFGTSKWRDIFRQQKIKRNLYRELITLYEQKLISVGYQDIWESEPMITNSRHAPLYRLIFASKHPFAHKLWNEATKKDVYGQPRLC